MSVAIAGEIADAGRAFLVADDEHAREYVRLFLNPEGAPCPPWQSVHCGEHALLGPAHHSALAWYRRWGVEPAAETEPADHIGLLLLFYAGLIDSGAPEGELRAFRNEHLAWMGSYCDAVRTETRDPYFRDLAERVRRLTEANQ